MIIFLLVRVLGILNSCVKLIVWEMGKSNLSFPRTYVEEWIFIVMLMGR